MSDGLKVKCSWCTSANKLLRTIGLRAKVTTTDRKIKKIDLILFVDILITLKKMETDDEENGTKEIVTKIGSKSFRKNNFSALYLTYSIIIILMTDAFTNKFLHIKILIFLNILISISTIRAS